MSVYFILVAIALSLLSGVPGLWLPRRHTVGQRLACCLTVLASLTGLAGVLSVFVQGGTGPIVTGWHLMGTAVTLEVDLLSAFFMIPVLLMNALGSIFGLGYWPQRRHAFNGRKLCLFWGMTNAGMLLLMLSKHMVVFLLGWDLMAVGAFFMVSAEDHVEEVRKAGFIYLIATHAGTLLLFALFALLASVTGSFTMQSIPAGTMGRGAVIAAFLLMFLGFGLKAGIMPLHFWLPGAHANGPSHVSALMSGVLIKTGIYGVIRFFSYLPEPPLVCGFIILIFGCISGVLGVVFAIGQHDLKRLLAYHSIENIGIILMGLGVAIIGQALDRPVWIILGLAGCLLHVWNHGLFKSLLFLSAGSVIHASHTREIDRMGGMAKTMPWTATFFLVGAVAICGLPPLNGFVSEWLVYLGLLKAVSDRALPAIGTLVALAAPVLAIIGALALACFVKVYGAVFLGQPRRQLPADGHDPSFSMRIPMGILAGGCVLIGGFPWLVAPILNGVVQEWRGETLLQEPVLLSTLVPMTMITGIGLALVVLCVIFASGLLRLLERSSIRRTITWSCGYTNPTARMQYTASSFAQMLTGMSRTVLAPQTHAPRLIQFFAKPSRFESHQDDPVLDGKLLPAARVIKHFFGLARPLQRGLTNLYLLYIALTVFGMLLWTLPLREWVERLFSL